MSKRNKNEEWLPLRGAIALCEKHGRKITSPGLRTLGKESGFIRKNADGYHWEWKQSGLLEYLKVNKIPEGWVSVMNFARKMRIDSSRVYYMIKKYSLERKRFGKIAGKIRGIIHVREKEATAAHQKYKRINND